MPFIEISSHAPGRRSAVAVWKKIADTLATEIRDRAYATVGRLPGAAFRGAAGNAGDEA